MALIKEKLTQYGIVASYWKISKVTLNTLTAQIDIELQLFKDRDWRLANPIGNIETVSFSWIMPEMFQSAANMKVSELVAAVYGKIKEPTYIQDINPVTMEITEINNNWFSDAEDALETV